MSRFTTNVLSSTFGGRQQDVSNFGRFESAFHTHDDATFPARNGETLSEAMLATKSNAGIGSGSYYMKQNQQPLLLSEHTFKGQEQELSGFANRVATRHAGSGFAAVLSP